MSAKETQIGGDHYKRFAIQPAEFIQMNRLPWCEGNVIKYVTRHRFKNGLQDLEKAKHYIDLLIEIEYGLGNSAGKLQEENGEISANGKRCGRCQR
jgi:hypothetical protein